MRGPTRPERQRLDECRPLQPVHQVEINHVDGRLAFAGLQNGLVSREVRKLEEGACLIELEVEEFRKRVQLIGIVGVVVFERVLLRDSIEAASQSLHEVCGYLAHWPWHYW